jgi:hypothetical protein
MIKYSPSVIWRQLGDFAKRGFLARRSPRRSEDETEICAGGDGFAARSRDPPCKALVRLSGKFPAAQ